MAHIFQINISEKGGKPKYPIHDGYVIEIGIQGDKQRNPDKHGGTEKALSLFSLEKLLEIQKEGIAMFAGGMGENLIVAEMDWSDISIGDKFLIGDELEIEISSSSGPCKQISLYYEENTEHTIKESMFNSWTRYYARVIQEGYIRTGDTIKKID